MSLKKKIINKQLTIGSWITLGNTGVAEILSNSGFDWLVVDLEHTTISLDQAGELIRTIELSGVPSLVRLTSNDESQSIANDLKNIWICKPALFLMLKFQLNLCKQNLLNNCTQNNSKIKYRLILNTYFCLDYFSKLKN